MREEKEPLREGDCTVKAGSGKPRCEFNDSSCSHPQWEHSEYMLMAYLYGGVAVKEDKI